MTSPFDHPFYQGPAGQHVSPGASTDGAATDVEDEEFRAVAGEPLPPGAPAVPEEPLIEAMQTVYDPEIPVNIYDLGLIYTVDRKDGGDVSIEMSLTAPGCPVAGEMPGMVAQAVAGVSGVGQVDVTIVWDPAWTPERMSEDAKLVLGMY